MSSTGAITLIEAAKLLEPTRERGVIQTYAEGSVVLASGATVIKSGPTLPWKQEDTLPYTSSGNGVRNVNADFTARKGSVKPYESQVKILGGKIEVDRYIKKGYPERVGFERMGQIKALARNVDLMVFGGSGGEQLRGIKDWIDNDPGFSTQNVDVGSAGTPAVITFEALDEMLFNMAIGERTKLYMNAAAQRKLMKDARDSSYNIREGRDELGTVVNIYNNIPIYTMRDGKNADLINVDGSDGMEVYCVSWGEDMCTFHSMNGSISGGVPMPDYIVTDDGTEAETERMEWYTGLAPQAIRSIGRLRYVKNAIS